MSLLAGHQIVQLSAWFLALIFFILSLYVLLLNAWHTANRHVSGLLLLLTLNNFAIGLMAGARDASQATLATYLLAAVAPAVTPYLFIVNLVLMRPQWLRGRWRWGWRIFYVLTFLPCLLTAVDVVSGTQLWYTGLDPETYTGGYEFLPAYITGSLSTPLLALTLNVAPLAILAALIYILVRREGADTSTHRLTWMLLGVLLASLVVQFGLERVTAPGVPVIITDTIFVVAYAYAIFQEMISGRRLQRGRLQFRLVALVLATTVPVLVATVALVSTRAGALIKEVAFEQRNAELLVALWRFQWISWAMLGIGVAVLLILVWLTIRQALRPVQSLTDAVTAIAEGDLTQTVAVESADELGVMARAFNRMTERLRELIGELEQRVADRTRELQENLFELESAAQIASQAASIRDVDQLLDETVHLISVLLGFYHTGIFLLDDAGEYAVLRATSSEGGRRMLERGHQLRVGREGIVGYVAESATSRIALDVGEDAVHFSNPDLPRTHSEMAVPLEVRGEVIGVLDVQSEEVGAFTDQDVAIIKTLADQIALAIENARLLNEMQRTLREMEAASAQYTRESWRALARSAERPQGYRFRRFGIEPTAEQHAEAREAQEVGRPVVTAIQSEAERDGRGASSALAVPVKLRDQIIGVLDLRFKGEQDASEIASLVEEVSDRLALALENARLLEETRGRVVRERLTREITDRMRRAAGVEGVVQSVVNELYEVLGASRAFVHLGDVEGLEQTPAPDDGGVTGVASQEGDE